MTTEASQTELPSSGVAAVSQTKADQDNSPSPEQQPKDNGPSLEQQQNLREMRSVREELATLRRLIVVALAALTVMAWGLGVFAWRQMTFAHRQLEENRLLISEYERKMQPLFRDLLSKLQFYAAANPDFKPIFSRYYQPAPASGIPGGSGAPVGAGTGQPRPPGR